MRSSKPDPRWLSISAYARLYGVTRPTVYKWIEAGLLVTYRVGPCIRLRDQPPLPAYRVRTSS